MCNGASGSDAGGFLSFTGNDILQIKNVLHSIGLAGIKELSAPYTDNIRKTGAFI